MSAATINLLFTRRICTTATREGKRNFRKFILYNKRGTRIFKEQQRLNPDPEIPIDKRGVRDVGYVQHGKFVTIPEMIPEIIVPDLTDCKLKPYVSYRAPDVVQSQFTAEDLFHCVYGPKIIADFKDSKLYEDGSPKEPSECEKLDSHQAKQLARQTGSDMY